MKPMGREGEDDTFVDGYMCSVDFECELGMASGGHRVFGSIDDLLNHKKCVYQCGIVKVRVQYLETITEPDYNIETEDDVPRT